MIIIIRPIILLHYYTSGKKKAEVLAWQKGCTCHV